MKPFIYITNCFKFLLIYQQYVFVTPAMANINLPESWLEKTEDGVYKHIGHKNNFKRGPNGGKTLHDLFIQAVKQYPQNDFLGTIDVEKKCVKYISYLQTFNKIVKIADYLGNKCQIKTKSIIGILSKNKEEWFVSEQAILRTLTISCPLYGAYGVKALAHILQQTEMETIFLESEKAPLLHSAILESECVYLKRLIFFDKKILEKVDTSSLKDQNEQTPEQQDKQASINALLADDRFKICFYQDILDESAIEDYTEKQIRLYKVMSDPLYTDTPVLQSSSNKKGPDYGKIFDRLTRSNPPSKHTEMDTSEQDSGLGYINSGFSHDTDDDSSQYNVSKSPNVHNQHGIEEYKPPKDELHDVITICYTSGTTGLPKGVLLTDRNFIGLISGFCGGNEGKPLLDLGDDFIYISYLPLAHSMEKISFYTVISLGGKIGFSIDPRKRLVEDIEIIKPKLLPGVPIIFDRIKQGIVAEIEKKNSFVKWLFWKYLNYKIQKQKASDPSKYHSICLDYIFLGKIRAKFGNNIRLAICGSAPLSESTNDFFSAVFSVKIYQGYGQTEALAANTLQTPYSTSRTSVGIPLPSVLIKLVDTCHEDLKEICLRGQAVSKGYYKNVEETNKTIKDGWLHTGDIGEFNNGELYITGRIKDTFKLSNGEFIAPEMIESLYYLDQVQHVLISHLPSQDCIFLIAFIEQKHIDYGALISQFRAQTESLIKAKKLSQHTRPSFLITIFIKKSFEDLQLITPTNKKKRREIQRYFQNQIAEKVDIELQNLSNEQKAAEL